MISSSSSHCTTHRKETTNRVAHAYHAYCLPLFRHKLTNKLSLLTTFQKRTIYKLSLSLLLSYMNSRCNLNNKNRYNINMAEQLKRIFLSRSLWYHIRVRRSSVEVPSKSTCYTRY
eukprot:sb/3476649/